jgi:hypothetical protein
MFLRIALLAALSAITLTTTIFARQPVTNGCYNCPPEPQLGGWLKGLGKEPLDLWRETMTNLRQLPNDVWNGARFFLTVNGILLAGIAGLVKLDTYSNGTALMVVLLGVLGLAVTLVARRILKGHRDYYTEMLLRKTLIEYDLGFYSHELSGIDLSFPWRLGHLHAR